jgi:23S rRNA (cytosine1962-C5)-methyltransferase
VDRATFQQVVAEAALRSGRAARLLGELHADLDHPVAASHPEGEYLKGWMVHVQ